jgi:hypothetical protein
MADILVEEAKIVGPKKDMLSILDINESRSCSAKAVDDDDESTTPAKAFVAAGHTGEHLSDRILSIWFAAASA